jgi:hypothetical protein
MITRSSTYNIPVITIGAEEFEESLSNRGPPLWSSGQSSWLQIQRSGFDSWRYQIIREVVGLKRGLLSLMSATEELLE